MIARSRITVARLVWLTAAVVFHIALFLLVGQRVVFVAASPKQDSDFKSVNIPANEVKVRLPPPSLPSPPLPSEPISPPSLVNVPSPTVAFKPILPAATIPNLNSTINEVAEHFAKSSESHGDSLGNSSPPPSVDPSVDTNSTTVRPEDMQVGKYDDMPFRYFVPKIIAPQIKYPLVMFLHGAGEKGIDNVSQLKYPSTYTFVQPENQKNYPCFYVAPQSPISPGWFDVQSINEGISLSPTDALRKAMNIINYLIDRFPNIDSNRIYVTGLSSGGVGAWSMAALYPNKITAIATPSGNFPSSLVKPIVDAKIPDWTFFSSNDRAGIPIWCNQLRDLLDRGGDDMLTTVYDGRSHNTWDRAYSDPELLPWLFSWSKENTGTCQVTNLATDQIHDTRVRVTWTVDRFNRSSLHGFKLYRNDKMIKVFSTYKDKDRLSFDYTDKALDENTQYTYSISSINSANQESPSDKTATAKTTGGIYLPEVDWLTNLGTSNIIIHFEREIDPKLYSQLDIYSIDKGVKINSVSVFSDRKSATLNTSELSPDAVYHLTLKYSTLAPTSFASADDISVAFHVEAQRQLIREYWVGVKGFKIVDIPMDTPPLGFDYLSSLEGPSPWFFNYGAKIRGYLIPPTNGIYHFTVAGTDDVQFLLSTDSDPANKSIVAATERRTGIHEWNVAKSQQSSDIKLVANHPYYFEVLHKVGSDVVVDNFSVAWQPPNSSSMDVISGDYCVPYPDLYFEYKLQSNGPQFLSSTSGPP